MMSFAPRKKLKLLGIIGLALSLGLGFWWWTGRIDTTTISPQVSARQVVFNGQLSSGAALSLAFTRDRTNYSFVNVAIDLNQDGQLAAYPVNGQTQEEWIARNVPARVVSDEGSTFAFQLRDSTISTRTNFKVTGILSHNSFGVWPRQEFRRSAWQTMTLAKIDLDDASDRVVLDPSSQGTTGFALASDMPVVDETPPDQPRSADTGTLDTGSTGGASDQPPNKPPKEKVIYTQSKEFNVFHAGVPDADQGKNECVPTSVSNSLRWLAKNNHFTDKLPISNTELLGELKDDFKWKESEGVVVTDNFLDGKEAFVKRHNLPLETHQVGNKTFDLNIMAKIAVELQKGQDVELDLEYDKKNADGTFTRVGGHMVTAVGAEGNRDGTQSVDIHDPASPGPSKLDRYVVKGSRLVDYQYQGSYITYIRFAIAESPIEPPATKLPDSAAPPTVTPTITTGASPTQTITSSSRPTSTSSSTTTSSSSPTKTATSASPTPTPTPTSTTSTSASPTPTSTTPVISGHYEPYTGDQSNGYVNDINVKITPTDLAGQTVNGVRIDLTGQGLPIPYGSDHKINATEWHSLGGSQDWNCTVGATVQCQGATPLAANLKSIFAFFFTGSVAGAPANLLVQLLSNGAVITTVSLPLQNP